MAVTSVVAEEEEGEEEEEAGYAGLARELAVRAPMLAVLLRLPCVLSGATVSAPPIGRGDRSVARALTTPGLLIMVEAVAMEVVEVKIMWTPGLLIMVEEDAGMEVVEARTGNLFIIC